MARFIGGPYEGEDLDQHQINAIAQVFSVPTERGSRTFLLMPSPHDRGRIERGEGTKEQPTEQLHPYERIFTAGGAVEFHSVADTGALDDALADQYRPLDAEAMERRKRFGELASRFAERVQSAGPQGIAEVNLIVHYVDQQGNPLSPVRHSIMPAATVKGAFPAEVLRAAAGEVMIGSILATIDAQVRRARTGLLAAHNQPGLQVRIHNFELEIIPPE